MKNILYIIIISVLFFSCRKEDLKTNDKVIYKDIKGMVFNNCTDSALAGVKVYLEVFREENNLVEKFETISGKDGNFIFTNIGIHSDENYTYAIDIKSLSGTNAPDPSYSRFDGTTMYFHNYETDVFLKPKVTPGFFLLNSKFNSSILNPNDSIRLTFEQKTFIKNKPGEPGKFYSGAYGHAQNSSFSSGGYPMGIYNITIDKWRGGVHTRTYDSLYVGWAQEKTYAVNW